MTYSKEFRARGAGYGHRAVRRISSHYETAAARQHRWARGDWQLCPGCGFGLKLRRGVNRLEFADRRGETAEGPDSGDQPSPMILNLRRTLRRRACSSLCRRGGRRRASPVAVDQIHSHGDRDPHAYPFLAGLNPRLTGISKKKFSRSDVRLVTGGTRRLVFPLPFSLTRRG